METLDDRAGEMDALVGAVIRTALEKIKREEPDKAKWLMGLIRNGLSRSEFRSVQQDWEREARNLEIIDRLLPNASKSRPKK